MDEQFHEWGKVKWLWWGALGLSETVGVVAALTHGGPLVAIEVGGGILVLFLLAFGAYYSWRRSRARSRRHVFAAAIEAQTTVAPRSVNDPNERAALDRLRQKFQAGLSEFTSRGRDIYKLPWYVIIGEPGSGKTEAIRHSGIDFPPGLQNELQGSGGTVNMDWWFTNHGVMLDTAGRLLFNETPTGQTPEWTEFLRLLRKARGHCPINGLFIVLSVESLIKDSTEKIAQKASRMAQQLDLIQRTLDVRFPVYLLVSKCDLLTGFRDFFESVDDPLLQHQMFGWSNPDPLDAAFRPDLVDEHLKTVGLRIRRRRLWLLRESLARRLGSTGAGFRSSYDVGVAESTPHRAEEAEALFALPESIQRLAPRLRRYLETIFVAGEWSAKPVFLRGIYFTSSMREGKALDEAIAFATGLPLDQLPEDGDWQKDRAFFLRDLFLEKVFREAGLVTRATNTMKLLRSRWLTVYGSTAAALLLFLGFAIFGYKSLNSSARREAELWKFGAAHWDAWSPGIVSGPNDQWLFGYTGNDTVDCRVPFLDRKPTLVEYHRMLQNEVEQPLPTGWVFKPISWLRVRGERQRQAAQRVLFEQWILKPLVSQTRTKMMRPNTLAPDSGALERHRDALIALLQIEADGFARRAGRGAAGDGGGPEKSIKALLSYLLGREVNPDPNLMATVAHAYGSGEAKAIWPPDDLLAGDTLSKNAALAVGLGEYHAATVQAQTNIFRQIAAFDRLVDGLEAYRGAEQSWLTSSTRSCQDLSRSLSPLKTDLAARWENFQSFTNISPGSLTNLGVYYESLQSAASNSSAAVVLGRVDRMLAEMPGGSTPSGLIREVQARLQESVSTAVGMIEKSRQTHALAIPLLERDQLTPVGGRPAFEVRWGLYAETCALDSEPAPVNLNDIGRQWVRLIEWNVGASQVRTNCLQYDGPFAEQVASTCSRLISAAAQKKRRDTAEEFVRVAQARLADLTNGVRSLDDVARAQECFAGLDRDLEATTIDSVLGESARQLSALRGTLPAAKHSVVAATDQFVGRELGFPILAASNVSLTADGLLRCRHLIEQLMTRLTNPTWGLSSHETADALVRLQSKLTEYGKVADSLIDTAGRVTQARLSVYPWQDLATEDKDLVGALRYVQIPGFVPEADLTRASVLATIPVDQEVSIYFRKAPGTRDPAKALKRPRWWILQAICSGEAVPLEGGTEKWRLRLPLADQEQRLKGHVVFDVQFPSGTRLPRKEDWPR